MSGPRLYRLLLLAFPASIRGRHGDDMAQLFADRCREARAGVSWLRGTGRLASLWLLAIRDAAVHGLLERRAASPLFSVRAGRSRGPRDVGVRRAEGRDGGGRRRGTPGGARETLAQGLLYDLRHAARDLATARGFTAVALASLALGIGAATAIFTLVNAVVLRPLPVVEPHRLVQVTTARPGSSTDRFTNPQWESLRDRVDTFDGLFATGDFYFDVDDEGGGERLRGAWVSGGFFATLGLTPAAGRLIDPADDQRGCPAIAVLDHGYWQRRYGGDAAAVGGTISVDGHRFEIVGVAPPEFKGITIERTTELYAPLCAEPVVRGESSILDARNHWWLRVVGRMGADARIEQVGAALASLAPAILAETVPQGWGPEQQADYLEAVVEVQPAATGFSGLRDQYQRSLFVLLAAVGVVMLVVCSNLANLLLARAARRRREVAMRVALGASGRRLLQQFLTESLLLTSLGAAAGLAVAHWTSRALVLLISPRDLPISLDLTPDLPVLAFTAAVSLATGVLFGLAPAVHALRVDPYAALRGGGRAAEAAPSLLAGGVLVAAQVTLSLVLLTGATLLVATFWRLETLDAGFARDRVLLVEADLGEAGLEAEARRQTFLELRERLEALPGVQAASFAELTPISGNSVSDFVVAAGFESLLDEDVEVFIHRVGDGYFASMGAPVIRGRDFDAADLPGSEAVAVVSESTARLLFGSSDVVGRRFHTRLNDTEVSAPIRVIGVVRDAKYRSLREAETPTAYFALRQQAAARAWGSSLTFHVLPEPGAPSPAAAVRAVVEGIAAGARAETSMLSEQLSASLARERLLAMISGFFGSLALFLAVIGLYGVMSFNVSRRFPEIGVRLALGATQGGVFALVLRQAARPVLIGLLLGGLGSLTAARAIASFLYGLGPYDPRALALSAAVLAIAAMASAAIPAQRAARLDPAVVLRQEA
jgi:predicted permease